MSDTAVNGVEPIIFLDDVHVTFRTRTGSILHPNLVHAVQGVTIKLMPGQTIGIVGESGCGKSTTANVMCGLQAPTSGKVYFKGKDVTKRTAEDRRHMGRVISVVFQNPATALNPRMVVREQLLDPMRVHNLGTEAEQEKRVKELLELTGLPSSAAEVLPGQLSGGQRQRVAIARALSLNPDAIIADEPTSALDVSVRAQILNLLTDLKKELGLAMVFISHDIQTVRYISDDIIVYEWRQDRRAGRGQAGLPAPPGPLHQDAARRDGSARHAQGAGTPANHEGRHRHRLQGVAGPCGPFHQGIEPGPRQSPDRRGDYPVSGIRRHRGKRAHSDPLRSWRRNVDG